MEPHAHDISSVKDCVDVARKTKEIVCKEKCKLKFREPDTECAHELCSCSVESLKEDPLPPHLRCYYDSCSCEDTDTFVDCLPSTIPCHFDTCSCAPSPEKKVARSPEQTSSGSTTSARTSDDSSAQETSTEEAEKPKARSAKHTCPNTCPAKETCTRPCGVPPTTKSAEREETQSEKSSKKSQRSDASSARHSHRSSGEGSSRHSHKKEEVEDRRSTHSHRSCRCSANKVAPPSHAEGDRRSNRESPPQPPPRSTSPTESDRRSARSAPQAEPTQPPQREGSIRSCTKRIIDDEAYHEELSRLICQSSMCPARRRLEEARRAARGEGSIRSQPRSVKEEQRQPQEQAPSTRSAGSKQGSLQGSMRSQPRSVKEEQREPQEQAPSAGAASSKQGSVQGSIKSQPRSVKEEQREPQGQAPSAGAASSKQGSVQGSITQQHHICCRCPQSQARDAPQEQPQRSIKSERASILEESTQYAEYREEPTQPSPSQPADASGAADQREPSMRGSVKSQPRSVVVEEPSPRAQPQEQSIRESVRSPYAQPQEQSIRESVRSPQVQAQEQSIRESVRSPYAQPQEQSIQESVRSPYVQPQEQSIHESVRSPQVQPQEQSIRESVRSPYVQPQEQSIRESVRSPYVQPQEQSIHESVRSPYVQPQEQSVRESVRNTPRQPVAPQEQSIQESVRSAPKSIDERRPIGPPSQVFQEYMRKYPQDTKEGTYPRVEQTTPYTEQQGSVRSRTRETCPCIEARQKILICETARSRRGETPQYMAQQEQTSQPRSVREEVYPNVETSVRSAPTSRREEVSSYVDQYKDVYRTPERPGDPRKPRRSPIDDFDPTFTSTRVEGSQRSRSHPRSYQEMEIDHRTPLTPRSTGEEPGRSYQMYEDRSSRGRTPAGYDQVCPALTESSEPGFGIFADTPPPRPGDRSRAGPEPSGRPYCPAFTASSEPGFGIFDDTPPPRPGDRSRAAPEPPGRGFEIFADSPPPRPGERSRTAPEASGRGFDIFADSPPPRPGDRFRAAPEPPGRGFEIFADSPPPRPGDRSRAAPEPSGRGFQVYEDLPQSGPPRSAPEASGRGFPIYEDLSQPAPCRCPPERAPEAAGRGFRVFQDLPLPGPSTRSARTGTDGFPIYEDLSQPAPYTRSGRTARSDRVFQDLPLPGPSTRSERTGPEGFQVYEGLSQPAPYTRSTRTARSDRVLQDLPLPGPSTRSARAGPEGFQIYEDLSQLAPCRCPPERAPDTSGRGFRVFQDLPLPGPSTRSARTGPEGFQVYEDLSQPVPYTRSARTGRSDRVFQDIPQPGPSTRSPRPAPEPTVPGFQVREDPTAGGFYPPEFDAPQPGLGGFQVYEDISQPAPCRCPPERAPETPERGFRAFQDLPLPGPSTRSPTPAPAPTVPGFQVYEDLTAGGFDEPQPFPTIQPPRTAPEVSGRAQRVFQDIPQPGPSTRAPAPVGPGFQIQEDLIAGGFNVPQPGPLIRPPLIAPEASGRARRVFQDIPQPGPSTQLPTPAPAPAAGFPVREDPTAGGFISSTFDEPQRPPFVSTPIPPPRSRGAQPAVVCPALRAAVNDPTSYCYVPEAHASQRSDFGSPQPPSVPIQMSTPEEAMHLLSWWQGGSVPPQATPRAMLQEETVEFQCKCSLPQSQRVERMEYRAMPPNDSKCCKCSPPMEPTARSSEVPKRALEKEVKECKCFIAEQEHEINKLTGHIETLTKARDDLEGEMVKAVDKLKAEIEKGPEPKSRQSEKGVEASDTAESTKASESPELKQMINELQKECWFVHNKLLKTDEECNAIKQSLKNKEIMMERMQQETRRMVGEREREGIISGLETALDEMKSENGNLMELLRRAKSISESDKEELIDRINGIDKQFVMMHSRIKQQEDECYYIKESLKEKDKMLHDFTANAKRAAAEKEKETHINALKQSLEEARMENAKLQGMLSNKECPTRLCQSRGDATDPLDESKMAIKRAAEELGRILTQQSDAANQKITETIVRLQSELKVTNRTLKEIADKPDKPRSYEDNRVANVEPRSQFVQSPSPRRGCGPCAPCAAQGLQPRRACGIPDAAKDQIQELVDALQKCKEKMATLEREKVEKVVNL